MSIDRWHPSGLIREAAKNSWFPSSRAALLLTFAIFVGAGQVGFLAYQWHLLATSLHAAEDRGRNIITFQPPSEESAATIDALSCEALGAYPAVERSGTVVFADRQNFTQIGSGVQVVRASEDLIPDLKTVDAVVGHSLLTIPGVFVLGGQSTWTATVGTIQPPGIDVNSAVVFPLNSEDRSTKTCIVKLSAYANAKDEAPKLASQLSVQGGAIVWVEESRDTFDLVQDFTTRPERFTSLLVGAIGALLALTQLRSRSSELATYRLSGTSVRSLLLILMLEQWFVAGVALLSATLATMALHAMLEAPASVLGWCLLSSLLWIALYTAGSYFVVRKDPISLAKDR